MTLRLDALRQHAPNDSVRAVDDAPRATEPDQSRVVRAKEDRAAFAVLYDHYLDPVYRFCHARLGSREAAEDATSVVFTKALRNIATCRDDAFRAWLFTIARNVVNDHYRAGVASAPLDAAQDLPDPAPAPDELAVSADEGRWLRALLAHLPADQREIIELRLAGLTGPEIARVIGRSHAAVRFAQHRAYLRLRALAAVHDQEESNRDR
ncbi:MAG: RNA polymerase sigma factor [Thermomicrobiales bacterium]